ncbi:hypothetical protein FHW67_002772 [Herbaspirillum sp. Sphag1AN]|uniref:LysM peptidoglycan-binding domain-containing protein n=1 Tax=unclassified Herbaspirillum TaxID=2624150 RepID=UPI00161350F5|nr:MULTISPECIES: N-acetylmuramidase domain-containing protein [unclassified Herbaspirillum]MBB3213480.1 hypothetical protein [Herbaspirillum sp. Sphag1AN]MBB3246476.1 hypothetical protein [Herbaspirillum sp. Sphag64]
MNAQFYVVKEKDTLSKISRHTGVSITALIKLNNIYNPDRIVAGKRLALTREATCRVTFQFMDKELNPIRNLSHVFQYCGKTVKEKTDELGRSYIVTDTPNDQISVFVVQLNGGWKELVTTVSDFGNKLVTLISPKIKLELKTYPHSEIDESNQGMRSEITSTTQNSLNFLTNRFKEKDPGERLQSAWSWRDGKFGIRTSEIKHKESGKPMMIVTKDHPILDFLDAYEDRPITEHHYLSVAKEIGCDVAVIKAIAEQETHGDPFWKMEGMYFPVIVFERHWFRKLTGYKFDRKTNKVISESKFSEYSDICGPEYKKQKKINNKNKYSEDETYGTKNLQLIRLSKAYKLDKEAALKSCSWGMFQIMGFNHLEAGYSTAFSFVKDMSKSEFHQFEAFKDFCLRTKRGRLRDALVSKDWEKIASHYNGNNWKNVNPDYAINLKKFFDKYSKYENYK